MLLVALGSSSVKPASIVNQNAHLDILMAAEIPKDFTGAWITNEELGTDQWWSISFNETVISPYGPVPNNINSATRNTVQNSLDPLFFRDTALTGVASGCRGSYSCKATITAPALAIASCVSKTIPVNYNGHLVGSHDHYGIVAYPLDQLMFTVTSTIVLEKDKPEWLDLVTAYSTTEDCKGVLNITTCSLVSAIGSYDITITEDAVTRTYLRSRWPSCITNILANYGCTSRCS
jgi:hypothetical protein